MSAHPLILTLDQHGTPHRWVSWQHACFYYAKDLVAWAIGEHSFVFHGGINRLTGTRSEISANSIIAIKGKAIAGRALHQVPPLSNRELFHRDRHVCAYCGEEMPGQRLTRDHVVPLVQGGRDTWMNVVTACFLSPSKSSLPHRVSELKRSGTANRRRQITGSAHHFGSRVHWRQP